MFYTCLTNISDTVIVFEEALRTRLSRVTLKKNIHTLTLTSQDKQRASKKGSRKVLQLPQNGLNILVFGYINGYKGIPWIIRSFIQEQKNKDTLLKSTTHLVIAGGKNPYLKEEPQYKKLYNDVVKLAKKSSRVIKRGFVSDKNIQAYFSAADVIVLPYEVFMSSSGPLTFALSYGKPVLFSEVLKPYMRSKDFKKAMRIAQLSADDLFFSLDDKRDLWEKIQRLDNEPIYRSALKTFSQTLHTYRNETVQIQKYEQLFNSDNFVRNSVISRLFFKPSNA